jgi:hypothetical protein
MRRGHIDTTISSTEDFTATLDRPASPDAVVALFISAAGVSRWWGPTVGDGTVDGTLVISFGEHGENVVRVLEAGPSRVIWEPIVADGSTPTRHTEEWLGTTIEVDVLPADTGAQLRFRHRGLTSQLVCWDDCLSGWNYFMSSIELLVRTGTGTPYGS